jgi:hypothetical protein
MKFRVPILLLCLVTALCAQTAMNVDQLADMVRSELALKQHTDKQVAAYLKKVQLTEKLPSKTIEDLEEQGAGPKTIEALKQLQTVTAALKPPAHDATYAPETAAPTTNAQPSARLAVKQDIPAPTSVRQKAILDRMRDYALNYTDGLPNFICVQVTRRYVQPAAGRYGGSEHHLGDILAKVSYNQGQENYKVFSVNGKYSESSSMEKIGGGATSTGEFGSMMKQLFAPESEAEFTWNKWVTLRGRIVAVFSYSVDGAHTKYSIDYAADEHDDQRIYTAYQGLVYADADTGEIARIRFEAVNIPPTFPVHEATEILDYGMVDISGTHYMCPLLARLYMRTSEDKTHNEIEFRDYRKFGAESSIIYGAIAPPPLTPDQTEEQPADKSKQSTKDLPKPAAVQSNDPWSVPTLPPPPPK